MIGEVKDITDAYWKLVRTIKENGIKNFTSFYPAMTLNFQQFILEDPKKNWLEATGLKYNIFWTLREFSDRMSDDPYIQNPGHSTRFDRARWASRIEGPKTIEKMKKLQKGHPKQHIEPENIRPGVFSHSYGERWHAHDQLKFVNDKLKSRIRWNHIFLNVWDFHEDNHRFGRRVPCTVGIQFIPNDYTHGDLGVRERTLEAQAIMRNNLVNSFFISDVFCFTTLFQWLAAKHKFKVGRYSHVMGKVYYRFKVGQQIRVVNSLNDYEEHRFNIYDYYQPTTFESHKFEVEWKIKEEIEARWRDGDIESDEFEMIGTRIHDEHIRNWLYVMLIGEMTLIKSKDQDRFQQMYIALTRISNEWQYATARELILYIQKMNPKNKAEWIEKIFNLIPEGARIEFGKEVIFRRAALKDIVEKIAPGSYQRFWNVYRNLDIDESEFRGDEKAIRLHKELKEQSKSGEVNLDDD